MKARIKFAKFGVMKYIGHLDIMRYFQKCMRKGNIDIAYSGGFSPHQIMSFASPLGVGLESNGEYFDIELNSGDSKSVLESLNAVMVPGIEIISVRKLGDDVKNAMASIAAARYTVRMKEDYDVECNDSSKASEFMKQSEIKIVKQTKKQEMEFDLKPHIYEFDYDGQEFSMLVDASSAGNIKPLMVVGEYVKYCGCDFSENKYQVIREEIYTETKNGKLVSLESVGEEF